jgi:hypothetical protein
MIFMAWSNEVTLRIEYRIPIGLYMYLILLFIIAIYTPDSS